MFIVSGLAKVYNDRIEEYALIVVGLIEWEVAKSIGQVALFLDASNSSKTHIVVNHNSTNLH